METLIRERNGKEEIWYSDEYLKRQIELAYRAGINKGIKVNFHTITPIRVSKKELKFSPFSHL